MTRNMSTHDQILSNTMTPYVNLHQDLATSTKQYADARNFNKSVRAL